MIGVNKVAKIEYYSFPKGDKFKQKRRERIWRAKMM